MIRVSNRLELESGLAIFETVEYVMANKDAVINELAKIQIYLARIHRKQKNAEYTIKMLRIVGITKKITNGSVDSPSSCEK